MAVTNNSVVVCGGARTIAELFETNLVHFLIFEDENNIFAL
jgi:hypothetical protein